MYLECIFLWKKNFLYDAMGVEPELPDPQASTMSTQPGRVS